MDTFCGHIAVYADLLDAAVATGLCRSDQGERLYDFLILTRLARASRPDYEVPAMSQYNILNFTATCPRVGHVCAADAEFRFGLLNFHAYRVGDVVEFDGIGEVVDKVSPHGEVDVEGYAECLCCHKDYSITIHMEKDRITHVDVNRAKEPLVPDDLRTPEGKQLKWIDGIGWAEEA